ncbi:alanine racemase [Aurantiacibacter aquimixticola]|uniref:alanine racemase n=1 Tax=Aurantiacibacter aquimixticola TaxID=1958945 RepID=A0A419RRS0_9SPHN|nr:alanine racemase [Aurantiacibacter aquimixticola]RJY08475.1 alanine racemase [Aurantiacibacter aquimixticola]
MRIAEPPRSLRLTIDREALAENWRTLDTLSGDAATGAAVKADAYGIGVDIAVPTLRDAGCRQFFLAHWSEVPAVLAHVEADAVSILHGVRNAEEAAFAKGTGAVPVINSPRQAAIWRDAGGGTCHVMVDSGMNRLGMSLADLGDPVVQSLQVDALMSHLASADEDTAQNADQLAVFRKAVPLLAAKRLSLSNSAGIALGADFNIDLTRPGLALYGGIPHPALRGKIRQVAFPQAAIIQTRDLSPGDKVGYNAKWIAERPTRAGTVSLGYADGFMRLMGQGSALHFGEHELPILGRVSMDMVVVDLGESGAGEGDFLDVPFDLPDLAARSGLSQYEILTGLGRRFERF